MFVKVDSHTYLKTFIQTSGWENEEGRNKTLLITSSTILCLPDLPLLQWYRGALQSMVIHYVFAQQSTCTTTPAVMMYGW